MAQPHRVAAPVPGVEVADHRNAPRIGRPHREAHARHAVDHHRVRAQAVGEIAMLPFGQQIDVEFAEQRPERIRVLGLLDRAAPVDPQPIGAGDRRWTDEEAGLAHRAAARPQARLVARDRGDREGAGQHDPHDIARRCAVSAEHRERVEAAPVDDGLQRRREARVVIHRRASLAGAVIRAAMRASP